MYICTANIYVYVHSYYIIISIVLFNIVVAILLDEFMSAADTAKSKKKLSNLNVMKYTLDPLLAKMSEFTTPSELTSMIENLYKVCVCDASRVNAS